MNNANNSSNALISLKDMSKKELTDRFHELRNKTDDASRKEFKEVEDELIRRLDWWKDQPDSSISEKSSQEQIIEILDNKKKWALSNAEKETIKKLLMEEIKNQWTASEDIKKESDGKQSEIDRLTALLDDEKKTNNELLTDTPSLKEYYNLERRRLSTMLKKFDKFKKDNSHYPKNVLIYAMGVTNSKIFWTRQKLKRWRVTLAWKRKEDDIVANLKTMLNKLKPDSWERSKRKEAIKVALYKEIDLALKAHVEKLTKNNSLPPRN